MNATGSGESMFQNKCIPTLLLSIALCAPALAMPAQDQSASQDMKDAGHETKDAAKDAGRATKKTAKKTGHAVKKTTKKAAHKTAEKTKEGAQKVEDKTQPN
jgi:Ni/Co efflux regulator RcnB